MVTESQKLPRPCLTTDYCSTGEMLTVLY